MRTAEPLSAWRQDWTALCLENDPKKKLSIDETLLILNSLTIKTSHHPSGSPCFLG